MRRTRKNAQNTIFTCKRHFIGLNEMNRSTSSRRRQAAMEQTYNRLLDAAPDLTEVEQKMKCLFVMFIWMQYTLKETGMSQNVSVDKNVVTYHVKIDGAEAWIVQDFDKV